MGRGFGIGICTLVIVIRLISHTGQAVRQRCFEFMFKAKELMSFMITTSSWTSIGKDSKQAITLFRQFAV
jgi:hypothetical protein